MADDIEPPPNKKIRCEKEFIGLIEDCYKLKFQAARTEDEETALQEGLTKIREQVERAQTSSDISFGQSRTGTKITWGKCLSLMLEGGPDNLNALRNLCGLLSPGGGLL